MGIIMYANGETKAIEPANGTNFKLKEVQDIVGGLVDVINLGNDRIIIINDEGKLLGLPRNEQATILADFLSPTEREEYKKQKAKEGIYIIDATGGEEDYIAGDVLACKDEEFR